MAGRPKSTQIQYGQLKAAQLRQSILQAAVQGKLVPQNLHDEPASALLECIKREKAKLIKDGEIKKEKPLPPITEEEVPYDLPDGWMWCRLGHLIITSHSGWSPQCLSHGRLKEEWGVLKVSAVSWGVFKSEENKALPASMPPKIECAVQIGDFLISRANTDELVARSVIVDEEVNNLLISDKIVRFHISEYVNKYFINTANLSPLSRRYYIKHASGTSSSMKNVSREVMLSLPIALPPLAEQKRIVAKVDELMALCDELEAAEKELDALEANFAEYLPKSILQAAVQGKLVPQNLHDEPASVLLERIKAEKVKLIKEGKFKKEKPLPPITEEEAPCDLPYGWMWCRLGDIGVWKSGATPQRGTATYYSNGTIPWLKTGELNDAEIYDSEEKITESALRECSLSINHPDSLLLAMYGATIGKLGILKVAAATNQACCACSFFAGIKLKYAYYYLLSLRDELRKQGYGGAQPNISKGGFNLQVQHPQS